MTDTPTLWNINNTNAFIEVFGITKSIFYNESFKLCNGTSSNINSNTGSKNISIFANDSCTFLDNYNISESYARDNDPISITSSVSGSKSKVIKIASNLTDSVSGISFYNIAVKNCNIKGITMTPKSHAAYAVTDFDCANKIVNIYANVSLDYSTSSNELDITYEYNENNNDMCTSIISSYGYFFGNFGTILNLIAIFFIITILSLIVYTIMNPDWYSNLNIEWNWNTTVVISTAILIGTISIIAVISILIIHIMCGV